MFLQLTSFGVLHGFSFRSRAGTQGFWVPEIGIRFKGFGVLGFGCRASGHGQIPM